MDKKFNTTNEMTANNTLPILCDTYNFVTTITLNQPKKGNVLNFDLLKTLYETIVSAIQSEGSRIFVLMGRDGVFSRGMDFKYVINNCKAIKDNNEFTKIYGDVLVLIRNSPKPVISLIEGEVVAGGLGLVLASDIVLASTESTFALSEVLFGLIPAYVFPLLLERVSFKKARFIALSSKRFTAEQMHHFGIIDEFIDKPGLNKLLRDYLKRLLFSNPDALHLIKRYSDSIFNKNLADALVEANKQLDKLLSNEERLNAINNFLNGDKMPWSIKYKKRKNNKE